MFNTDFDFACRLDSVFGRLADAIDNANIIETVLSESLPADSDEVTPETLRNLAALRSVVGYLYLLHNELDFIVRKFREDRIEEMPAGKEARPEH